MLKTIKARTLRAGDGRFAIIASQYNGRYVNSMLRAARAEFKQAGAREVQVVRVPGAYEIPVIAARLAKASSSHASRIPHHPSPSPPLRHRLPRRDSARGDGACGAYRRGGEPRADGDSDATRGARHPRGPAAGE